MIMERFCFDAVILRDEDTANSGAFVAFPYDTMECFGARRAKVCATFDGVLYRGSIVNMGTGPVLGVLKSIRQQIGKQAGDTVHVQVWKDEEERVVEQPQELQRALEENAGAKRIYDALSYSHRREYAQWIGGAKQQATREKRAQEAVNKLLDGKKSP